MLSAPSGAGKTTLARYAVGNVASIRQSVSCTTRPIREGEVDGVSYVFVDRQRFKEMIQNKAFIEYATVHENYYGTPIELLEKAKREKYDLLLVIDVQGAAQIRGKGLDAVFIFVKPPSMEELKRRLGFRGSENDGEIEKRLEVAKKEIEQSAFYDHVIVNDDLETAQKELGNIIAGERERSGRGG